MNEIELREAWDIALDTTLTTMEGFVDCLDVETKDRQVVSFADALKAPQRRLERLVQQEWEKGRRALVLVGKARQIGMSTVVQAMQVEGVLRHQGLQAITVSYEVDQAEYLHTKAAFFVEQVPRECRPEQRLGGKSGLAFRHYSADGMMRESRLAVRTAKNTRAGRGFTAHRLHMSEPTFYEDNKRALLDSVMNAVPNAPGCYAILEFTGNGYEEVQKLWAASERGENDYVRLFVSWMDEPEYQMALEPGEADAIRRSLTEYERMLHFGLGATFERIKWYRYTLRNNCDGHHPSMKAEYPSTPDEMWQSTGRPVFNTQILKSWEDVARAEWARAKKGVLVESANGDVVFQEIVGGLWTVYEEPQDGKSYAWAADTAEGKIGDKQGRGEGDASCGTILQTKTRKKAAIYHGRQDIDVFADEMRKAAKWYGLAWGHVEANGVGQAFLTASRMLGFREILYRTRLEPTVDGSTAPEIRPGFMTTSKTKEAVILRLVVMTRNLGMRNEWKPPVTEPTKTPTCPFDLPLIEEMYVYERSTLGKMGAKAGKHDDRIMSRALAEQALEDVQDVKSNVVVGLKTAAKLMIEAQARAQDDPEWAEAQMDADEHNARARTLQKTWRAET